MPSTIRRVYTEEKRNWIILIHSLRKCTTKLIKRRIVCSLSSLDISIRLIKPLVYMIVKALVVGDIWANVVHTSYRITEERWKLYIGRYHVKSLRKLVTLHIHYNY